ncbi:hypothetical protein PHMEG_00023442 [Phytophthora megakarya]|uniref:HAT C-terminal dimerisation domain-containing protein n=1 Tax=Phytophthora megakarya TaxID=4795 RepID=A0A225VGU3_9STRA|nr:hypothetical protein PHMEG_00023442 [Phytophthora megakarya]
MRSVSSGVPVEVEFAVQNYSPKAGFEIVAQGPTERSFIYKWGVRVRTIADPTACGWICLANQHCRSNETIHVLYGGKTSRVTKHLKNTHQITSSKPTLEDLRKRTRDEVVARIRAAAQTQESCERISLLLQTLLVVHNNLPFIMGEWEESQILRAVVTRDNFQAVINRRTITHSVIELYVSAKLALVRFIFDNRLRNVKSMTMVADFWTAKNPGTKFLGLRAYFITEEFELVSVLLGTRHFQPLYGERDSGIRGPFKRWIIQILSDFGLTISDFFGSTTDGGSDVQHMMNTNLKLSWEWCMPHLTNAATKAAFGMTSNVARSKNPEMLQLLKKVTRTVYQVRSVEIMGDLYEQLVRLLGVGKEKKLIDYKPHTQVVHANPFTEDVSELFTNIQATVPVTSSPQLLHENVIDAELERWFRDPSLLQPVENGLESALHFWMRQQKSATYRVLPSVARVVFACPASSAQIERDFGISGQMVTVQRCSLSPENIDMCSFLHRNREFIDVTQCSKLTAEEARDAVPLNVRVNLDPLTAMEMFESDWEHALVDSFSANAEL